MRKRSCVLKHCGTRAPPRLLVFVEPQKQATRCPVIGLLKRMNSAFIGHLLSREKRCGRQMTIEIVRNFYCSNRHSTPACASTPAPPIPAPLCDGKRPLPVFPALLGYLRELLPPHPRPSLPWAGAQW